MQGAYPGAQGFGAAGRRRRLAVVAQPGEEGAAIHGVRIGGLGRGRHRWFHHEAMGGESLGMVGGEVGRKIDEAVLRGMENAVDGNTGAVAGGK